MRCSVYIFKFIFDMYHRCKHEKFYFPHSYAMFHSYLTAMMKRFTIFNDCVTHFAKYFRVEYDFVKAWTQFERFGQSAFHCTANLFSSIRSIIILFGHPDGSRNKLVYTYVTYTFQLYSIAKYSICYLMISFKTDVYWFDYRLNINIL